MRYILSGSYDRDAHSRANSITFTDDSRTKQSFKEEVDINTIVRRFNLTGQLPTDVRAPTYADFEDLFDFRDAMDAIRSAQESFAEMPANVRYRFHNDPAEFVDFCSNPDNVDEMIKLGLAVKRPDITPDPAPQPEPAPPPAP